jgi:hypothetical protein
MITEWHCAFLAKEALRVCFDVGEDPFTEDDAFHAATLVTGLYDRYQLRREDQPHGSTDELYAYLMRIAQEQFGFQAERHAQFVRTIKMHDLISDNGEGRFGKFLEKHRVTATEFLLIGMVTLDALQALPNGISEDALSLRVQESGISGDVQVKVKSFLQMVTASPEWFREKLKELGPTLLGQERNMTNPIFLKPIVQSGGSLICPALGVFFERITVGLHWDFLDLVVGNRPMVQEITSWIGRNFEAYVGELLRYRYDPKVVFEEREYRKRGVAWRTPDWMLFSEKDAVVFECKTTRFTVAERNNLDMETIHSRLKQDIYGAVTNFEIKDADIINRIDTLSSLPSVRRIDNVIVTLERWLPEPVVMKIVEDLRSAGNQGRTSWHLMHIEQLELAVFLWSPQELIKVLREKLTAAPDDMYRSYFWNIRNNRAAVGFSAFFDKIFDAWLLKSGILLSSSENA